MKCDLHSDKIHSGNCRAPGLSRICRESCKESGELYEVLKRVRGMDLVTGTDHNSIDAAEELRQHPDFNERGHIERPRRRTDREGWLTYALESRLFVGVEVANRHLPACANRLAATFGRHGRPVAAGGDSHTLHSAGRIFAEISGVRNASEFVTARRRGEGVPYGESNNCRKVTQSIAGIGWSMMRSNRQALGPGPLFVLVSFSSVVNYLREVAFVWYWGRKNRMLEPEGAAPSLAVES